MVSKQLRFALIFFPKSKDSAVVSTSNIRAKLIEADELCEVQWNRDEWLEGKIVELGNNKQKLDKIILDRNGRIWDDTMGPKGDANLSKKKAFIEEKRTLKGNAQAAEKNRDNALLQASPFTMASFQQLSSSSVAENPVPEKTQKEVREPEEGRSTITLPNVQHEQPGPSTSHEGKLTSVEAVQRACEYFAHAIAPTVTSSNIAFFEKMLKCAKIVEAGGNAHDNATQKSSVPYPCDLPGKGRVELIAGSQVWIAKTVKELIVHRNTVLKRDPHEMLRQLLKDTVHPDNLVNLNVGGRGGGLNPIPNHIYQTVKDFVTSFFKLDKPEEMKKLNKTANNLCGGLRRSREDALNKLKPKTAKKSETEEDIALGERVLRSTPNKRLLPGIQSSPSKRSPVGRVVSFETPETVPQQPAQQEEEPSVQQPPTQQTVQQPPVQQTVQQAPVQQTVQQPPVQQTVQQPPIQQQQPSTSQWYSSPSWWHHQPHFYSSGQWWPSTGHQQGAQGTSTSSDEYVPNYQPM